MADISGLVIDQSSLADQVYENLKLLILSGSLAGGERVPEEHLAQQFGVSRTPIREALKRLAEYGLVSLRPRLNAVVASLTAREAQDIARVRLALELLALNTYQESRIDPAFDALQGLADECQRLLGNGERARAFEVDSEFHTSLIEGAGNGVLAETYRRLDARIQLMRIGQRLNTEEMLPYAAQHGELIEALRAKKTQEAKRLLEDHVMHDLPD
jgi:DNA-binding GntR family transcriptional regulator